MKNPDLEKEANKDKENKDEKERSITRDLKLRNKKEDKFREKLFRDRDAKLTIKPYRDREEKTKYRDMKHQKKYEEKKFYGKKDERENFKERTEERRGALRDERKFENKDDHRDYRDRKIEEKRGKSYEKMRQEKKRLSETKRQSATENIEDNSTKGKQEEFLKQHKKSESTETNIMQKDTRPTEIRRSSEAKSDGIKHLKEKEMEEKPKAVEDETSNLESRSIKKYIF